MCVGGGRQKGPERLEPQLLGLSTPPIAACLSGQECPEPGGDACASAELPQHMLTASQGLTHSNLNAPISQRRKLRRRRARRSSPGLARTQRHKQPWGCLGGRAAPTPKRKAALLLPNAGRRREGSEKEKAPSPALLPAGLAPRALQTTDGGGRAPWHRCPGSARSAEAGQSADMGRRSRAGAGPWPSGACPGPHTVTRRPARPGPGSQGRAPGSRPGGPEGSGWKSSAT